LALSNTTLGYDVRWGSGEGLCRNYSREREYDEGYFVILVLKLAALGVVRIALSLEKKLCIITDICTRNLKWTIILFDSKITVIRNYFGIVFGTLKVAPVLPTK
jgi:hypothetical protein